MISKKLTIYAQEKGHCPERTWETTFGELSQTQKIQILKTGKAEGPYSINEKGAGGATTFSIEKFNKQ